MNKLRPIMFVGTGSDVGKSIINAAFCRIFKQDGFSPAPFKAQNMSLNSYSTPDGLEIGRAQAVQAEACKIQCSVEMNPILLKPTNYLDAQVVLNGKPIGNKSAKEYFDGTDRDFLFNEAMKAFQELDDQYNPIVIEGAGSISEINLRDRDITNMRVALEKNAAVYLIADIDKGGVFGSVYGTLELLPPEERALVKGIIINKFRGDISLFEKGRQQMEDLCKVPVVSVIPYYHDIYIEDEDSVVLDKKRMTAEKGKVNIAVVLLRHMSNFTDFDVLEKTPGIHLYYAANALDIEDADVIIIPGTKNTISDLLYLKKQGIADSIFNAHQQGTAVYGICGGFQMMGKTIFDPDHIEGDIEIVPGLDILPVHTIIREQKVTEQCSFDFMGLGAENKGYEIHMGETKTDHPSPLCTIDGSKKDGYFLNPKTWGTYLHGIFDNSIVLNYLLDQQGSKLNSNFDYRSFKEQQYDLLADLVKKNTNLSYIYDSIIVD